MNTKFDSMKATQAASRKAHFNAKGTVGMWRGRATTFQNPKHVANKKACRGRISQEG